MVLKNVSEVTFSVIDKICNAIIIAVSGKKSNGNITNITCYFSILIYTDKTYLNAYEIVHFIYRKKNTRILF